MKTFKEYLEEATVIDNSVSNWDKHSPLKDTDTIRVYHGFNSSNVNDLFGILI